MLERKRMYIVGMKTKVKVKMEMGEERREGGERERRRNTHRRPPLGQHVIDIRHHYQQGNTQKQGGLNVSIYSSLIFSDLPFSCS